MSIFDCFKKFRKVNLRRGKFGAIQEVALIGYHGTSEDTSDILETPWLFEYYPRNKFITYIGSEPSLFVLEDHDGRRAVVLDIYCKKTLGGELSFWCKIYNEGRTRGLDSFGCLTDTGVMRLDMTTLTDDDVDGYVPITIDSEMVFSIGRAVFQIEKIKFG